MPHEESRDPVDPHEWLRRAKSNLLQAKHKEAGIYFEDLLFLAQQAVEKAFKALLLHRGTTVPHTHSLARLITEIKKHVKHLPPEIENVAWLTDFSVEGRYPNAGEPVQIDEYKRGIAAGSSVIEWVESQLLKQI